MVVEPDESYTNIHVLNNKATMRLPRYNAWVFREEVPSLKYRQYKQNQHKA
jgi:hypothetical protein